MDIVFGIVWLLALGIGVIVGEYWNADQKVAVRPPEDQGGTSDDQYIYWCQLAYIAGRIEIDELERCLEHVLRGGLVNGDGKPCGKPLFERPGLDRLLK